MSQRGSVLMLMPAVVLVLVILGAIALDSAIVLLAQRQLADFTSAAADEAASAAQDPAAFYQQGALVIDQSRAERIVATLRSQLPRDLHSVQVSVDVAGSSVTVHAIGTANDLFGAAIPGARHHWTVSATSTATARLVTLGR